MLQTRRKDSSRDSIGSSCKTCMNKLYLSPHTSQKSILNQANCTYNSRSIHCGCMNMNNRNVCSTALLNATLCITCVVTVVNRITAVICEAPVQMIIYISIYIYAYLYCDQLYPVMTTRIHLLLHSKGNHTNQRTIRLTET